MIRRSAGITTVRTPIAVRWWRQNAIAGKLHFTPIGQSRARAIKFQNLFHGHGGLLAVVILYEHELGKNLPVDHPSVAGLRSHAAVAAREFCLEFLIRLIFIAQTAHEPPAASADFGGIEGGFLRFGGFHGDWGEHLEKLLAAAMLAALFIISN